MTHLGSGNLRQDDYDTDKIGSGLLSIYEDRFRFLKDRKVRYLEVGIWRGGSLEWARDFFANPDSEIIGIDREILPREFKNGKGVYMIKANQADADALTDVGKQWGQFDLIIDDGCHFFDETRITFDALFPFLKGGGFYVVEDWGACYRKDVDRHHQDRYTRMDQLIAHILLMKENLGIDEVEIVHRIRGTFQSYAIFKKGEGKDGQSKSVQRNP
jgi:hypothetical protein